MNGDSLLPIQTDACWNRIGIGGDRSCPELTQVILCRNCPVYGSAARSFFNRTAPDGYVDEWMRVLAQPVAPARTDDVSMLVFRLRNEWLALRIGAVQEVTRLRPVHRIPHRSNDTLVGMVNLRGQLHLLVSLHGLLGIEDSGQAADSQGEDSRHRLVVIGQEGRNWVFRAEEVRGVQRFNRADFRAVPSNLANPKCSFSQAVVLWESRSVGFLDDQRVLSALGGMGR